MGAVKLLDQLGAAFFCILNGEVFSAEYGLHPLPSTVPKHNRISKILQNHLIFCCKTSLADLEAEN